MEGLSRGECRPDGYLTTEHLAALWTERCREASRYREERPDDLKGIDLRQRQALTVLQAYRLLSGLEPKILPSFFCRESLFPASQRKSNLLCLSFQI